MGSTGPPAGPSLRSARAEGERWRYAPDSVPGGPIARAGARVVTYFLRVTKRLS